MEFKWEYYQVNYNNPNGTGEMICTFAKGFSDALERGKKLRCSFTDLSDFERYSSTNKIKTPQNLRNIQDKLNSSYVCS